MTLFRFQNL